MWDIERYVGEKASFYPDLPYNIRKLFCAESMGRIGPCIRQAPRRHDGR